MARVDVTKYSAWDDSAPPRWFAALGRWELIPSYVGNAACLMFLDGSQEVWKFDSGADLLEALRDCPPLEF
jgi:hypothetical protein